MIARLIQIKAPASTTVELTPEVAALIEAMAASNGPGLTRSDVADELLRRVLGLPSEIPAET